MHRVRFSGVWGRPHLGYFKLSSNTNFDVNGMDLLWNLHVLSWERTESSDKKDIFTVLYWTARRGQYGWGLNLQQMLWLVFTLSVACCDFMLHNVVVVLCGARHLCCVSHVLLKDIYFSLTLQFQVQTEIFNQCLQGNSDIIVTKITNEFIIIIVNPRKFWVTFFNFNQSLWLFLQIWPIAVVSWELSSQICVSILHFWVLRYRYVTWTVF